MLSRCCLVNSHHAILTIIAGQESVMDSAIYLRLHDRSLRYANYVNEISTWDSVEVPP